MEERHETASTILDKVCASTFTRHANLSEADFLKEIGRETDENEDVAVREARMNLMIACTKEVLALNEKLKDAVKVLNIMQRGE